MKQQFVKIGGRLVVTALACVGIAGVAYADPTDANREGGVLSLAYLAKAGSGGTSATFDQSMYDKINLGPLSSSLWVEKRGARGPLRDDEENRKTIMQTREIERQLGPIGGRNTP
jgi:hypothetical protein